LCASTLALCSLILTISKYQDTDNQKGQNICILFHILRKQGPKLRKTNYKIVLRNIFI